MRVAALALCVSAALASTTTSVQFGMYDADLLPDGGWQLMSEKDFTTHRVQFIEAYNANAGIDVIAPFKTKNCCIAVAGNKKLTITGSKFDVAFPAATTGGIRCNPREGYTESRYKFYMALTLDREQTFSSKSACMTGHNPGIFMRQITSVATQVAGDGSAAMVFGMYDLEATPAGGWQLMGSADFAKHADAFIQSYNDNGGVSLIRNFQSGNCCVAVRGGNKLTVTGSSYGYMFPASTSGGIRCNPTGGYSEAVYTFYKMPKLDSKVHKFGEKQACSTNHNPAIFMLRKVVASNVEFGLYDAQKKPAGGWQLMSAADLTAYKQEFVSHYNAEGGVRLIESFQSGNCCVALRNNLKLTITGTPYGYQFPSAQAGGIRCNPSGGYTDARYKFYKVDSLKMTQLFAEKEACTVDHNPGLYFRGVKAQDYNVWSATHSDDKKPVQNIDMTGTDCEVTDWSTWSTCSARCGEGTHFRVRSVKKINTKNGSKCPALREDARCVRQDCPVHCEMDSWKKTGDCDATCGGGYQKYTRDIKVQPNHSGDKCPSQEKQEPCNTKPCKVHCKLTQWGGWGECNAACGGGTQISTRRIEVTPAWGGSKCDSLTRFQPCNTQACPIDCQVSEWSLWSDCSQQCGGGESKRLRTVINGWKAAAANGGAGCPPLSETRKCNSQPCQVDCVQSDWTNWGSCSATCGTGVVHRFRRTLIKPLHGGAACKSNQETKECNAGVCPVHCVLPKPWGAWSPCSKTCTDPADGVKGTQFRLRKKTVQENTAGTCECKTSTKSPGYCREEQECENKICALHCQFEDKWSDWGSCSDVCGGGIQRRYRAPLANPSCPGNAPHCHGGQKCAYDDSTEERRACNTQNCAVDCVVSEWGKWDDKCSAECGPGVQFRYRHIQTYQQHGGKTCDEVAPVREQSRSCQAKPCPQDCIVPEWPQEWSHCENPKTGATTDCGGGVQTQTREFKPNPNCPDGQLFCHGGRACPSATRTRACNVHGCPVHCELSAASTWSSCDRSCSTGTAGSNGFGWQLRTRIVTKESRNGGRKCPEGFAGECDVNGANCDMFGGYHALKEKKPCSGMAPCPVHCLMGEWNHWSDCNKECGGGLQSRSRFVVRAGANGGRECQTNPGSATKQTATRSCNEQRCAIHCKVGKWSDWTVCTKSCGTGLTSRVRAIVQHAQHGGFICPALKEEQHCNTIPCAVHCKASGWSQWSACSRQCGPGTQSRTRSIVQAALHHGTHCDPADLVEEKACKVRDCPIDCKVSDWSLWSECTVSCGEGTRQRTRSVDRMAEHGGMGCPHLKDVVPCGGSACPINCEVGPWQYLKASPCSLSCGTGSQTVRRAITQPARHDGAACPALEKSVPCNQRPCPTDCAPDMSVSNGGWGHWTSCTATCGDGRKTRSRKFIQPTFGGRSCPPEEQVSDCNMGNCPVHCDTSKWGTWSLCTVTCGTGGSRWRERSITQINKWNGHECPELRETDDCPENNECPVDCVAAAWGDWSLCSKTCGSGEQERTRKLSGPFNGGRPCSTAGVQKRKCNEEPCPVDCTYDDRGWSNWGECSKTCGMGKRTRSRAVKAINQWGGKACGALEQSEHCDEGPCPVHCRVSQWTPWGPCSKTCGAGTRRRTRIIIHREQHNGAVCPILEDLATCTVSESCPVQCEMNVWDEWSTCSKSCGYGSQTRARTVKVQPQHGGIACPPMWEKRGCNMWKCPVHCSVTGWQNEGGCSKSCGGGMQKMVRSIIKIPQWNGHVCPALRAEVGCNSHECPVDCSFFEWSAWGSCSRSCGSDGFQQRFRSVRHPARFNGRSCADTGPTSETRKCSEGPCPVHCEVTPWGHDSVDGAWSDCSATCGQGTREQTREIVAGSKHCLEQGIKLSRTQVCQEKPCPQDCRVSGWSTWSACSRTCAGGSRTKSRRIEAPALYGGECPEKADLVRQDEEGCSNTPCPVDCVLGGFMPWSTCDRSCGSHGTRTRKRYEVSQAAFNGKTCKDMQQIQTQPCYEGPCPVDCVPKEWNQWGSCSATCGVGRKTRTRGVKMTERHGGKPCGSPEQVEDCMVVACPQDCKTSDWSGWADCDVAPLAQCENGKRVGLMTRTKEVISPRIGTGAKCGEMKQSTACSVPCYSAMRPAAAPSAAAARDQVYKVSYTTGWFSDSSCQSKVEVRFLGTEARSGWYTLNDHFARDSSATVSVAISEKVGLLSGLMLRAAGDDTWNVVNFVDVETPRGDKVQFRANVVLERQHKELEGLGHEARMAHGLFPIDDTVGLRAVNKERVGDVSKSVTLRWVGGARSKGYGKIQFHGTAGQTRFYNLESYLQQKQLVVHEQFGYLRKITLLDARDLGWTASGALHVEYKDPAGVQKDVAFPMETHETAGRVFVNLVEQTITGAGIDMAAKKDMQALWGKGDGNSGDQQVAVGPNNVKTTTAGDDGAELALGGRDGTHKGVAAATLAKTSTLTTTADDNTRCPGGKKVGWKGAGYGNEYCNMWTCQANGEFAKTHRTCGAPQINDTSDFKPCKHITCSVADPTNPLIVVQHSKKEHLSKHVCTYHKVTGKCNCVCKAPWKKYTDAPQNGVHNLKRTAEAVTCDLVHLPQPYNPNNGDLRVMVSAGYGGDASISQQDAATAWVQSNTHERFVVCTRTPLEYMQKGNAEKELKVQWVAFQQQASKPAGLYSPFDAQGSTAIEGLDEDINPCQKINFAKSFSTIPKVLGSVDDANNDIQQVLASHVEQITRSSFRVCFHNSEQLAGKGSARPRFNWVAFVPKASWAGKMDAGQESAGVWSPYPNVRTFVKPVTQNTFVTCKEIGFNAAFSKAPTVLVTANHEDPSQHDWSSEDAHPSTMTWVNGVSKDSFKVCSSERSQSSLQDLDNTLKWDWVAIEEPVVSTTLFNNLAAAAN